MAHNLFNIFNQESKFRNSSADQANKNLATRSPSLFMQHSSMHSLSQLSSSMSLESLKSRTAQVSSNFISSIKDKSNRVTQIIRNSPSPENDNPTEIWFPSIFEQLKWPNLSLEGRRFRANERRRGEAGEEEEEESVVDRFVRVIQSEDREENPQSTFYNHPARVHLFPYHP